MSSRTFGNSITLSLLCLAALVAGCTASSRDRTLTHHPLQPETPPETSPEIPPEISSALGRHSMGDLRSEIAARRNDTDTREPFTETIPTTEYQLRMIPIPGGALEKNGEVINIQPFYMLDSEITWDAYDIFLYEKDKDAGATNDDVDAVTRPSKPYIPPDRRYGHEGYPAIGIAHQAAEAFCEWLSAHTGKKYRLPTEHEWEYAAQSGTATLFYWGDNVDSLGDYAWTDENADLQTQHIKKKKPNAWKLYDMFGNAAEWVNDVDAGDKPFVRGGHFMNTTDQFNIDMKEYRQPEWSMSDPQIPKSPWWLSDGPHVGFRIVCVVDEKNETADKHR